jgi:hypothetical protein
MNLIQTFQFNLKKIVAEGNSVLKILIDTAFWFADLCLKTAVLQVH